METFITLVTENTKKEQTYLNPKVFDMLMEFKNANQIDTIEMFQSIDGQIFNFYVSPPVSDELIEELSDNIDDYATSTVDDETFYCAFAFNKF
jgi:hypothetical protein